MHNKCLGFADLLANSLLVTTFGAFCPAQTEDWYPGISDRGLRDNKKSQDRDKILDNWSKDRNDQGIWRDVTIIGFFPDWLRNSIVQAGTTASRNAIIEAKIQKKLDF
jgi:hypothetical protein